MRSSTGSPIFSDFCIRSCQSRQSRSRFKTAGRMKRRLYIMYCHLNLGLCVWTSLTPYSCLLMIFSHCRSLQCNSVRSVTSIHVLDPPGFQNPASVGKTDGALFDDLCHNYEHERLQKFFHDTVFAAQMERYSQVLKDCFHVYTSISTLFLTKAQHLKLYRNACFIVQNRETPRTYVGVV